MVGFCGYKCHPDGVGEICGLYVDPEIQGRGAGYRLLRDAELIIARSGAKRSIVEASLAALPFYTRAGYSVTEQMTHLTRGGLEIEVRRLERPL
ncbi:MAG: GNAT family N-acetyltransferase [Pseudomonadota bacterium]